MFERLIKLVRQEKVSLFIGSGFSLEAGVPSVSTLKKLILDELDDDKLREEHKDDNLDVLSEFFVEETCEGSRNELISLMRKAFSFESVCMDDHKLLASIPHFKTIFTTNYDTLLEDSYQEDERNVVRNDVDCSYTDNRTTIYKIHGDFTAPDDVVITSSDYDKYKNPIWPNPLMWDHVITEFTKKNILFIGYSLYDDNVLEIIKRISERIGDNKKQMFLIDPYISNSRRTQLKKMGITYYCATASEFLTSLNSNLLEFISADYKHGKISTETYSRFCANHNIRPRVCPKSKEENQIIGFQSIDGSDLQQKLVFTVGEKYRHLIEGKDFEKNGVHPKDGTFPDVPQIRLTTEQMSNCRLLLNGLVVEDNITEFIISPVVKDLQLTIRIPSRGFIERITAKSYKVKEHKAILELDCNIYKASITMEFDDTNSRINISFSYAFNKTYSDNSLAIKWIDLLIAFFAKEPIYINEFSKMPVNVGVDLGADEGYPFDKHKRYYENLKQIEIHTGVSFKTYNAFTELGLRNSIIALAYLTQEAVNIEDADNILTIEGVENVDWVKSFEEEKEYVLVASEPQGMTFSLNDQTFEIPYIYNIYNSCMIKDITPNNNGFMNVNFVRPPKSYSMLFTDSPVEEVFPGMKSIV